MILSGSGQNVGIIRTAKANILHADNVEVRLTQQQAAHDVAIEIFVSQESQHG
jgi:hypothetical protein